MTKVVFAVIDGVALMTLTAPVCKPSIIGIPMFTGSLFVLEIMFPAITGRSIGIKRALAGDVADQFVVMKSTGPANVHK